MSTAEFALVILVALMVFLSFALSLTAIALGNKRVGAFICELWTNATDAILRLLHRR